MFLGHLGPTTELRQGRSLVPGQQRAMPRHNLPTSYSPSHRHITYPSDNPRTGCQLQNITCPGGSSSLSNNHSPDEAGQNAPHEQLPCRQMTEIHRQGTECSPACPSCAQVPRQGHAMANGYSATNWAGGFPVHGTPQSQDLVRQHLHTSNNSAYFREESIQTQSDAYCYFDDALPREPSESTGRELHEDLNNHQPPWSGYNQRSDPSPISPLQGMQNSGYAPPRTSASTTTMATMTTNTTTTSTSSVQCPYCPVHFTGKHGKGNLGRHKRQFHRSVTHIFHCERGCDRSYKRKDARVKHYKNKHRLDSSQETTSHQESIIRPADQDYLGLGYGQSLDSDNYNYDNTVTSFDEGI